MARTTVVKQTTTRDGLEPVYTGVTATDFDQVLFEEDLFLHVFNASGGSVNITVPVKDDLALGDEVTVGDKVVAIPAGEDRMIGPFPTEVYKNADGYLYIDNSSATSVTLAVIELGSVSY